MLQEVDWNTVEVCRGKLDLLFVRWNVAICSWLLRIDCILRSLMYLISLRFRSDAQIQPLYFIILASYTIPYFTGTMISDHVEVVILTLYFSNL